jgi:pimeloyl-ACP methyl ester carboxylesterase
VRDLETVVDATGLDRFPLLGISQGGPVAVAHAVRHPERVTHLVVLGAFARGRLRRATTQGERELEEACPRSCGSAGGDPTPCTARSSRRGSCPKAPRRSGGSSTNSRGARRLRRTRGGSSGSSPTSTSRTSPHRDEPDNVFDQSRELASLIPGSALLPLDSCNHLLPERDPAWPRFLAALDAFLAADGTTFGEGGRPAPLVDREAPG